MGSMAHGCHGSSPGVVPGGYRIFLDCGETKVVEENEAWRKLFGAVEGELGTIKKHAGDLKGVWDPVYSVYHFLGRGLGISKKKRNTKSCDGCRSLEDTWRTVNSYGSIGIYEGFMGVSNGFHKWRYPKLDGFVQRKSQSKMDEEIGVATPIWDTTTLDHIGLRMNIYSLAGMALGLLTLADRTADRTASPFRARIREIDGWVKSDSGLHMAKNQLNQWDLTMGIEDRR